LQGRYQPTGNLARLIRDRRDTYGDREAEGALTLALDQLHQATTDLAAAYDRLGEEA